MSVKERAATEKTKMQEAEFTIQELLGVGFTLVVLGIGIAYGLDVTAIAIDRTLR